MTSSNLLGCSMGRSAALAPFDDLVDVDGRSPPDVDEVRVIGDQPTGHEMLAVGVA